MDLQRNYEFKQKPSLDQKSVKERNMDTYGRTQNVRENYCFRTYHELISMQKEN